MLSREQKKEYDRTLETATRVLIFNAVLALITVLIIIYKSL